jgi:hypothetical protein
MAEDPWAEFKMDKPAAVPAKDDPWAEFKMDGPTQAAQERPSALMDVAKSIPSGIAKGVTYLAGLPGDVSRAMESGIDWAGTKLGAKPLSDEAKQQLHAMQWLRAPASSDLQKAAESVTGKFYEPKTVAGQYANTIGEFAPAALSGPGGILRRLALQVGAPAVASETAGQATKGTKAEPYARMIAGMAAAPLAARAVTPFPTSAGRQALVHTLENEGVTDLTAGQRTGNKMLQYGESVLGDYPLAGQQATRAQENASRQFTQAALRRVGVQGEPTRANLDAQIQHIQNEYQRLSQNNTLRFDPQFARDITQVVNRYGRKFAGD